MTIVTSVTAIGNHDDGGMRLQSCAGECLESRWPRNRKRRGDVFFDGGGHRRSDCARADGGGVGTNCDCAHAAFHLHDGGDFVSTFTSPQTSLWLGLHFIVPFACRITHG